MPCRCKKCERQCDCGEMYCEDCIIYMDEDEMEYRDNEE